jgi:hypothetical protein
VTQGVDEVEVHELPTVAAVAKCGV